MNYSKILHSAFGFLISASLLCACGSDEPENISPSPTPTPTPTPGGNTDTPALSENLKATQLDVVDLEKLNVPFGNYSGITPIGNGKYAVVDDKAYGAGFVILELNMNAETGKITSVKRSVPEGTDMSYYPDGNFNWNELEAAGTVVNDPEGIVYFKKKNTVFVATEEPHNDPRVVEYTLEGKATGRELAIPRDLIDKYKVQEGFGFESLAYNEKTGLFWTTTEHSLLADMKEGEKSSQCRLMSFGEDLGLKDQYLYRTDEYKNGRIWGISEICALDDGRLIVMERNFEYPGCYITLYVVNPTKAKSGDLLDKKLVYSNKGTSEAAAGIGKYAYNYEGMCLGPKLNNGTQTLLLIADSDNNNNYFFGERIKVLGLE